LSCFYSSIGSQRKHHPCFREQRTSGISLRCCIGTYLHRTSFSQISNKTRRRTHRYTKCPRSWEKPCQYRTRSPTSGLCARLQMRTPCLRKYQPLYRCQYLRGFSRSPLSRSRVCHIKIIRRKICIFSSYGNPRQRASCRSKISLARNISGQIPRNTNLRSTRRIWIRSQQILYCWCLYRHNSSRNRNRIQQEKSPARSRGKCLVREKDLGKDHKDLRAEENFLFRRRNSLGKLLGSY
jgi:hypothetical protein